MQNVFDVGQGAEAEVVRGGAIRQDIMPRGRFKIEHLRGGKVIDTYEFNNGLTNQGKDSILDIMFNASTQLTTWYLDLIDDDGGGATLAATDTYAQIDGSNGWPSFTSYTDPGNGDSAVTRPEWTVGAASGQAVTNASTVNFDITGSGDVHGVFVVGGGTAPETKGDAAGGGTLWATAPFTGGAKAVVNGDQLRVTYTVSA